MRPLLRAIDANANRAREALRVMEDVARFALDHKALCALLKHLRHDLASALAHLPAEPIIARDTPHDVGTKVATDAEGERTGPRSIAIAAAKRLTEALRSIEEHAKALEAHTAAQLIEQIRYRAYDLEQKMVFALGSSRRTQWKLCVVLSEKMCALPWQDVARAALDGGADCIQLREKHASDHELLERAHALRAMTREHDAALIINDRADIAMLADADGVHLGHTDLPVSAARRIVGMERLIGASATTVAQTNTAIRDGADYVGLGPMFATDTTLTPGGRTDGSLAGPSLVREYLTGDISCPPHVAIGGINADNVHELVKAGCKGIAVCAAICASSQPGEATRELLARLSALAPASVQ